jgi:hypothetical protein
VGLSKLATLLIFTLWLFAKESTISVYMGLGSVDSTVRVTDPQVQSDLDPYFEGEEPYIAFALLKKPRIFYDYFFYDWIASNQYISSSYQGSDEFDDATYNQYKMDEDIEQATFIYSYISPRFGLIYGDEEHYIKIGLEPYLGMMYYRLNWNPSQDEFDTYSTVYMSFSDLVGVSGLGSFIEIRWKYLLIQHSSRQSTFSKEYYEGDTELFEFDLAYSTTSIGVVYDF